MYGELNYEKINIITYALELYFIGIFTFITALKITNLKDNKKIKIITILIINIIISIVCSHVRYDSNFMNSTILLILMLTIIFERFQKNSLAHSIIVISISLSINYIIFILSVALTFLPNAIHTIQSDYINFLFILISYIILWYLFTRIRRFKNGFLFLQKKLKNEYFEILILNISILILFAVIVLSSYSQILTGTVGMGFIIMSIIMFITIKESFQTYYKQKLLIKDLEETKKELKEKKKEIAKLEKENLEFSKTSHSIAHKQKSLEYKLNELTAKSETADELDIKDRISNISKQISDKETIIELTKSGIPQIDDMLSYMQSECIKNKIDFQLQISGNIFTMINNYVKKEELEILLADHIKDAIIAINYSENINKSVLVRLGLIDGVYSLYIYDSGIEFEVDTLLNLGKKPITTHADDGGTGMGFMNTFDTLRKNEASLTIKEIGKPSKNDFTKVIIIKFDKKNEFKIDSYRQ